MSEMTRVLTQIKNTSDCVVFPAVSNHLILSPKHALLNDLQDFYRHSDGIVFFDNSEYRMEIVSSREFVLANPAILVGLSEEELTQLMKDDISWDWYIVGKGETGEYILIDLASQRVGRCYYGFWDSYAMKGRMPIVATSFTDLLIRLLENKGQQWYWESETFDLGDAYDGLPYSYESAE